MKFRIGQISVRVSFLFFAVLTLACVTDNSEIAFSSLICAMLHEGGHIAALFFFGSAPNEIHFGIFGVRIQHNNYMLPDYAQMVVVLCGPLLNLALFAVMLAASLFLQSRILLMLCAVNLIMGVFNLMPILPLDGGRALKIVLERFFSEARAQRIMCVICAVMISGLIVAGIFLVLKTGVNISLLVTGIYLLVLCIKSVRIGY